MKKTLILIILFYFVFLFADYSIQNLMEEYRMYKNDQHFMSLIYENGVCALRPHPGNDPNGWGSTLYLQPFLPGAVLNYTSIDYIFANEENITVYCSGSVSYGSNSTWGIWNSDLQISYHELSKFISAYGSYSIQLSEPLSDLSGDLNLYKIASNYLLDVPLLDPPYFGDTGDMEYAQVEGTGNGFPLYWDPAELPGYFPGFNSDSLRVYVSGQYNNIDTAAQGYEPIEAAWKPSITVCLKAVDESMMNFGAIYDLQHAAEFWSDNIGITPLILQSCQQTDFTFDLDLFSATEEPGSENDQQLKNCYHLYIYPNPLVLSNNRTSADLSIRLDFSFLSQSQEIFLNILNIKGQKIIPARKINSLNQRIEFSSDFFSASGIYFVQINGLGQNVTKNFSVIR